MCTGSERGRVLFTDVLRPLQTQSRRQTRHRGPVRSLPAMAASCPLQPAAQAGGDTDSAQTHTALRPRPPGSTPLPASLPRTPQTCSPFYTFCHFKVICVQHRAGGCWGVLTRPDPLGLPGACGAGLPPPTDRLQLQMYQLLGPHHSQTCIQVTPSCWLLQTKLPQAFTAVLFF